MNVEAYLYYFQKTLEVATARVYNWDVTQKRKEKAEHGEDGGQEEKQMIVPNG